MKNNKKLIIISLMILLSMIFIPITYVNANNDILTIKSGYTDDVKIVGNDIYAKLDSSLDTEETINAKKLTDRLSFTIGYTYSTDNNTVYTGSKLNLNNSSNTTISQYNIYLIGDICKDSSNVININDVAYLRKAIVGYDMTSKTDYEQKTTDVNWSNGTPEEPGLGDIGDVIAIRRRILKYKWDDTVLDDVVPVVTTPPTTAVTEKTIYEDITAVNTTTKQAVIPQGFKVSSEESEQKIDTGLVVIAPDGSEFVWVPVEDVSTMYGTDSNGNKLGKLYGFTDSNVENNTALGWTETSGVMSWTDATDYREPDYLSDTQNGDASTRGLNLLNTIVSINGTVGTDDEKMLKTWKNQLQNEFNDMIDSVSKNGGFYVGRYETSLKEVNSEKIAQSKKGETSATGVSANTWYGFYQKEKEYSSKNSLTDKVGSSMIWGSQYDQMMIWMQKNGYNVASSIPKAGLSGNIGSITGTVETDKLNNVYDLLECGFEWTLEASHTFYRVFRGGGNIYMYSPQYRSSNYSYNSYIDSSSRLALYIK